MSGQGSTETAVVIWGDRYAPAGAPAQMAQALEASEVVDRFMVSDQIANFIPRMLWKPENTPMASVLPDPDSIMDAVVTAAYALGGAPGIGMALATDSIRRGPVEFLNTMLSFAHITDGRALFQIGSGEVKNIRPLGYKRQGLGKIEDLFRVAQRMLDDPSDFDFEGNHWTLKGATVGGARTHRPEIWGLGEGPKLLELATSYADGIASAVPLKFQRPEDCTERISTIRELLARKDRDPAKFRVGMTVMLLCHPDEELVDRVLDNPVIKWMTAVTGRVGADNWKKAGLESPVPEDWNYYAHYVTHQADDAFIEEALSKVTREHVEQSWIFGTPEQVAEKLTEFAETDLSLLALANYLPMAVEPDAAQAAFAGDIEVCGRLKAAVAAAG